MCLIYQLPGEDMTYITVKSIIIVRDRRINVPNLKIILNTLDLNVCLEHHYLDILYTKQIRKCPVKIKHSLTDSIE